MRLGQKGLGSGTGTEKACGGTAKDGIMVGNGTDRTKAVSETDELEQSGTAVGSWTDVTRE